MEASRFMEVENNEFHIATPVQYDADGEEV